MTRIRKPNRRSGPARVTQAGTSTSYPHPDHAGLARRQNRYHGEDPAGEAADRLDEVAAAQAAAGFPMAEPAPAPMMVSRPCGCTSMMVDGQPVQVSWCVAHEQEAPRA